MGSDAPAWGGCAGEDEKGRGGEDAAGREAAWFSAGRGGERGVRQCGRKGALRADGNADDVLPETQGPGGRWAPRRPGLGCTCLLSPSSRLSCCVDQPAGSPPLRHSGVLGSTPCTPPRPVWAPNLAASQQCPALTRDPYWHSERPDLGHRALLPWALSSHLCPEAGQARAVAVAPAC